ncbi:MAG: response regulator [Candidatus Cloacimonetes bacterium]|nr:response regulator [Candidatus Cloacimonadota bacterium]
MNKKIKILIVEDEAIIARSLKIELNFAGYEVCNFVASGEEAIREAKKHNPDVILMDIHLSGEIDGIKAAEKIIEYKKIQIIFMTGYPERNLFERAQKVNPAAYFQKPIEIYDLKPIIDDLFK